ncbi:P-loop NTPase fold protein [Streptomyces griseorubiginosus]|uniref:P-loop NTPase fold protein n=1 Tax=Streptomyces griseorubiginosus TaxID=67304 RepID=UPI001FCB977D|nr:P-loop NTPase fold protein [Streptomyces griseorubiginosus]
MSAAATSRSTASASRGRSRSSRKFTSCCRACRSPNIVYVLCFDREVVETALTDEAVKGSAYLEKIVKMSVEVPPLPSQALSPVIAEGPRHSTGSSPGRCMRRGGRTCSCS